MHGRADRRRPQLVSGLHERYCILDSDIVFFRDFDLARFEYPNSIPLLTMANEVTRDQPWHSRWVDTSHQLLGLPTPPFPAADFIGHIIFWDKQTTRALIARIEEVTGVEWIEALCRTHVFAEYMLTPNADAVEHSSKTP